MGNHTFSKKCAAVTVFLFAWFCLVPGFLGGREKKPLAEAQALISAGKYEEAAKILNDYIQQYSGKGKRKGSVAEAHYILARMYFEIGEDQKCDANLQKVFQFDPGFARDETNPSFRERVDKVRQANPLAIEKYTKKMKRKKFPWLLVIAAASGLALTVLILATKNKPPYLTVTKGSGIRGSPDTGKYKYTKREQIFYNYELESLDYKNLVVEIDGNAVSANGSVLMDKSHVLTATATPLGAIAVLDVDGKANCLDLDNPPATSIYVPAGQYNDILVTGTANYTPSLSFDDVCVFYMNSSKNGYYLCTPALNSGYSWPLGNGNFYAFFADTTAIQDNNGSIEIKIGASTLTVHAKNNCIYLGDSAAAKILLTAGDYTIHASGNAYYSGSQSFGNLLIRYTGTDGKDHTEEFYIMDSTPKTRSFSIGNGYLYAFFADTGGVADNSGKVRLEFWK